LHFWTLTRQASCLRAASTSNESVAGRRLRWADLQARPWVLPSKETLVRQTFMIAFYDRFA